MCRCCGCGNLLLCTFRRVLCLWGLCALCSAWRMPVLQSRAGLSWKGGSDAGVPGAQYKVTCREHEVAHLFFTALPWHSCGCWNLQLVKDGINAKASARMPLFCLRGNDSSCLPAATGSRRQGKYLDVIRENIAGCREPSTDIHVQLQMTLLCFTLRGDVLGPPETPLDITHALVGLISTCARNQRHAEQQEQWKWP